MPRKIVHSKYTHESESRINAKTSANHHDFKDTRLIGGATGIIGANENSLTLDDYLGKDGGPPRFSCPFIPRDSANTESKAALPLLIFLPGIDGTGINCFNQFPALSDNFDLRSFSIPVLDRTPFNEVVDIVVGYVDEELKDSPSDRPVYLLGESFGGILALAVGIKRPKSVHRLVLVNPATSFPDSIWPNLGPLLTTMP
eukprot:gene23582-28562_t